MLLSCVSNSITRQQDDALIVAGDVCTSLKKLQAALEILVAKFK